MSFFSRLAMFIGIAAFAAGPAKANPLNEPWLDQSRAIVIDAYEHNAINWVEMTADKRITAFIGKASDGDGEPWTCSDPEVTTEVCRLKFRRYFVAQELYQTRRALAKALGLKWGSYHLGRKGDPVAQADHYLASAKPSPDEVMALDIEGLDDKWMSLADAGRFVERIHEKTGRYPMLYVNGSVARHIAVNRGQHRLLSRLPLWYARFNTEIEGHFPKGNWDAYAMWQFSATPNCNKRRCPYRVPGAPTDIDVNVADMAPDALRKAWPFDDLLPEKPLPVLPRPHEPFGPPALDTLAVASTAPAANAAPAVQLVPLPATAPRGSDQRPRITFVAMGDVFAGWPGWKAVSGRGDRHGTAELMQHPAAMAGNRPGIAVRLAGNAASASTLPAPTIRIGGPD
jgi:GH25 family lysozyme M1 (1,4-beta-N-acetylmuramidase)